MHVGLAVVREPASYRQVWPREGAPGIAAPEDVVVPKIGFSPSGNRAYLGHRGLSGRRISWSVIGS
jgi:hypothetical protein